MKLTHLSSISLDKLKIVFALQKYGSFTKASEVLHITPSAANQALTALENQLGFELFIRRGKTIVPTYIGSQMTELYQPFAENLESLIEQSAPWKQNLSGQLKVFLPGNVGKHMFADPLLDYLKRYPQVNIAIEQGPASLALDELSNNNFDFAICGLQKLIQQQKWAESTPLFSLNMNLYCSPEFYAKNKTAIKSKKFAELPFTTGIKSQIMLSWYFEEILKQKFKSPSRFSMYDMGFSVQAVARGFGIGLLAKELVQAQIENKEIIEIGPRPLLHPMFLVRHKAKKLSFLERHFSEYIQDYFRSEKNLNS